MSTIRIIASMTLFNMVAFTFIFSSKCHLLDVYIPKWINFVFAAHFAESTMDILNSAIKNSDATLMWPELVICYILQFIFMFCFMFIMNCLFKIVFRYFGLSPINNRKKVNKNEKE